MLGELENQLIAFLKASEVGKRLKAVDSLPDTPDKDIVRRWGLEAPAAYAVALDGIVTDRGYMVSPFVVVLVARNARGHQAARQGDGHIIGLYEMVESTISLLHEIQGAGRTWFVSGYQFVQDEGLRSSNLHVALVAVQTSAPVPPFSTVDLGEFDHLYANWSVVPESEQDGKPLAEALIPLTPPSEESS